MFNNPFREEAAANRNQRQQLDHLLRVTAPHERIILAGIGLVLLAVAIWALFGGIERTVTADGLLIQPGNRHEVVTDEQGHLLQILVEPGDRVEAGARIARQSVPELERESEALRERVILLEAELATAGGTALGIQALLSDARVALLEMEARRLAKEAIVSQTGGEVITVLRAPGEYVPKNATVAPLLQGNGEPPTAVLRVTPSTAERIRPGMAAEIEIITPDSETRRLTGKVARITPGPLSGWLAAVPPAVADSLSRIDLDLHDAENLTVADGTRCRVRVLLGRQPPAALFNIG